MPDLILCSLILVIFPLLLAWYPSSSSDSPPKPTNSTTALSSTKRKTTSIPWLTASSMESYASPTKSKPRLYSTPIISDRKVGEDGSLGSRVDDSRYEADSEAGDVIVNEMEQDEEKNECGTEQPGIWKAILQVLILALGFLTFLFAFAVLVAHLLASFVDRSFVRRLDELREGVRGKGEMKVCLCGT